MKVGSHAMALEASCNSDTGNTIFDGAYEIISAVGRGRNSVVYEARKIHSRIQHPRDIVALKVLVGGSKDPLSNMKRMKREALAMLACRHPNIVRLLDYVAHDEICYSSMEYAAAGDLHALLEKRNSPISVDLATHFIEQVLSGLEAIHRAGIIHRDIKPENLLLTDDYVIKIGDFGVAHLPVRELSFEDGGLGIGTFDYIAPEALQDGIADPRSDTYSVAITFYQLLTNHLPFEGQSIAQQINQKIEGNFRLLEDYLAEPPTGLDDLFRVALATNPDDRFQSAREFLDAIDQFRRGVYVPKKLSRRVSPSFRQLFVEPEVAKSPFQELVSDLLVQDGVESDGGSADEMFDTENSCDYSNPPSGRFTNLFSRKPARFVETERDDFLEMPAEVIQSSKRLKLMGLSLVATLGLAMCVVLRSSENASIKAMSYRAISTLSSALSGASSREQNAPGAIASNAFDTQKLDSAPQERIAPDARAMLGSTVATSGEFPSILLSAERKGVVEHLFADGSDVSIATKPVGENTFAVTLGLYGWVPVEIDTATLSSELESGREFTVNGSGIKLVFTVEKPSDTISKPEQNEGPEKNGHSEVNHALHGTYREINSGRAGTWQVW